MYQKWNRLTFINHRVILILFSSIFALISLSAIVSAAQQAQNIFPESISIAESIAPDQSNLSVNEGITLSLDATFGIGGIVTTSIGNKADFGEDMLILSNGNIVVVGAAARNDVLDGYQALVIQYNPDGSLDPAWGVGGIVQEPNLSEFDVIHGVALQFGKVVVVGSLNADTDDAKIFLARYLSDGSLDTTFDTDGVVTTSLDISNTNTAEGVSLAIQPNGKIVVAAQAATPSSNDYFALARFEVNGDLDTSFGISGVVTTSVGSGNSVAEDIAIQEDGKIVLVGWANIFNPPFIVARYNTTGTLDTSFGVSGIVTTQVAGVAEARAVTIQDDGKIIVAGLSLTSPSPQDWSHTVARYLPDGSLDMSFNGIGYVRDMLGSVGSWGEDVAVLPDGRIVVGVTVIDLTPAYNDFGVAIINQDGSISPSSTISTEIMTRSISVRAVGIQEGNKIVVAGGTFDSFFVVGEVGVVRYNMGIAVPIREIFLPIVFQE